MFYREKNSLFDVNAHTGTFYLYNNKKKDFKKWRNVVLDNQVYVNDLAFEANIIENHDESRGASYFIPEEDYSYESVTALAASVVLLKGLPFLYQGQEIGMRNCYVASADAYEDIHTIDEYKQALARGYSEEEALKICYRYSRDNGRTPMQWSPEENAGFTTGIPWFQLNPNYKEINVETDLAAEKSIFKFYKKLIAFRKEPKYGEILIEGNTRPVYTEEDQIFAYERISKKNNQKILVISNYQNAEYKLQLKNTFEKVLLNNYDHLEVQGGMLFLKPYQTVVLK